MANDSTSGKALPITIAAPRDATELRNVMSLARPAQPIESDPVLREVARPAPIAKLWS
jgi:hypothetical protein